MHQTHNYPIPCNACKTDTRFGSYVEYRNPVTHGGYTFTRWERYCLECAKTHPVSPRASQLAGHAPAAD